MANRDKPAGFSPKGELLRIQPKDVLAAYGTGIFINDVVAGVASGGVEAAAAGDLTILGSAMTYSAASTVAQASDGTALMVTDHPDQLYVVQDDGSTSSRAIDEVHGAANHIAGAGSAVTFTSGHELAISNQGTTTGGFKILRVLDREDNDVALANADWVVQLNTGEGLLTLAAGV